MNQPIQPIQPTVTQSKSTGRMWPVFVVCLLLLNVSICAITLTLALRNPAAVTPNYYDRALNWDAENAQTDPAPIAAPAEQKPEE